MRGASVLGWIISLTGLSAGTLATTTQTIITSEQMASAANLLRNLSDAAAAQSNAGDWLGFLTLVAWLCFILGVIWCPWVGAIAEILIAIGKSIAAKRIAPPVTDAPASGDEQIVQFPKERGVL